MKSLLYIILVYPAALRSDRLKALHTDIDHMKAKRSLRGVTATDVENPIAILAPA